MKIPATLILLLIAFSVPINAQSKIRASQLGKVSQSIATTEISIEYNRPVARGRTLFGSTGLIKNGAVWMPGANEATVISFDKPILVNGKSLPSGRYSIWTIPSQDQWIIIFSSAWDTWHSPYPGQKKDVLRVKSKPFLTEHLETLTFYFPTVKEKSAHLRLHWGKTAIELKINVG